MTITTADLASDVGKTVPKKAKKPKKTEGADWALVASTKEELRALITTTVDKGIDDAGDLLLKRFFGDDHKRYGGKNPESPSLHLLLKKCGKRDLHVSRTFIGNALRLAVFGRAVKKGSAFPKLAPSHRIELLCLGDPTDTEVVDAVEALAEEAFENDYSVRQLRQVVEEIRGVVKRRKPVDRALDACVRATTDEATGELAFTSKDLAEMTLEQVAHVEEQALVLARRAQAIAALAKARREELASAPPPAPPRPEAAKAKVEKKAAEPAEPTARKPGSKEPVAAAKKGPASQPAPKKPSRRRDDSKPSPAVAKAAPKKPSRRRDDSKPSPAVAKATKRAAADEPAVKGAGDCDQLSHTSETTSEPTVKAAGEPAARKAKKTAT